MFLSCFRGIRAQSAKANPDADPTCFPVGALIAGVEHILTTPDSTINYAPPSAQVHELVATRLERRGVVVDRSRLMISHGSGHVLALLPHILVDVGDTIIVEGPTFLGAVEFFASTGARIELSRLLLLSGFLKLFLFLSMAWILMSSKRR